MSRSTGGSLLGRAAWTERRERSQAWEEDYQKEKALFNQRFSMARDRLLELMGWDDFETWWDSYPENMPRKEFYPIMEAKIKELEEGNQVTAALHARSAELLATLEENPPLDMALNITDELIEISHKLQGDGDAISDFAEARRCARSGSSL